MLAEPGDVIEPYIHCVTRVGFVIGVADSHDEVRAILDRALDTIKLETVPVDRKAYEYAGSR
jgi:hypothetical protein